LIETDLSPVHFRGLSLHVVFMLIPMIHDYKRESHGAILRAITDIVDAGALTPILDSEVYTLYQVSDAHARLASGKAMGKIVIDVAS
jgi:NADPH2:quinone reductase